MFQHIELNAQLRAGADRTRDRVGRPARRQLAPEPAPSIRRAIGYRIIEIGARLAAEPSLESARSR